MAPQESDSTDESSTNISRRALLGGAGSSLLAMSGMAVAGAVPGDADRTEIPTGYVGDQVIDSERVPKKWWRHVLHTRKARRRFDARSSKTGIKTGVRLGKDEIAGRRKVQIEARVPPEASNANVPDHVDGVPVQTTTRNPVTLLSSGDGLHHWTQEKFFNGGQMTGVTFGCEQLPNGEPYGTYGFPCHINDVNYMMTAYHVTEGANSGGCNDTSGTLMHHGWAKSLCEAQAATTVSDIQDPQLDYAFCEERAKPPMGSKMWFGNTEVNNLAIDTNLELNLESTTYYQQGHNTGLTEGELVADRTNFESRNRCADVDNGEGFAFSATGSLGVAPGDSGGPIFREKFIDGFGTFYFIAGVLVGGAGNDLVQITNDEPVYSQSSVTYQTVQNGFGTRLEHIDDLVQVSEGDNITPGTT